MDIKITDTIFLECEDMSIDDALLRLIEVIKSGPEFTRLRQAKAIISKNPELKRELEEFNYNQRQLYYGKLPAKEADVRMKQQNTKYESLSKIPDVKNYLNALNALNQVMDKINENISESLEKSLQ